jgi:flagellar basal-body rod modification protein FlgD
MKDAVGLKEKNHATQSFAVHSCGRASIRKSATAASASSNANGLADPNLFITLLTAQLNAQDPLNPMSPQDMVNQLTQVSSLQQLININQTLKNITSGNLSTTQANSTRNTQ